MQVRYCLPASCIRICLPSNVPGKAADDSPNTLLPATHVGNPDRTLGFSFRPGPAQPVAGI